jgi:hypothetical protein
VAHAAALALPHHLHLAVDVAEDVVVDRREGDLP